MVGVISAEKGLGFCWRVSVSLQRNCKPESSKISRGTNH